MQNFCGKCGSQIDEKTGKCPKCDSMSHKLNNQKTNKKEKKPKGKKKGKLIAIISIISAIVIMIVAGCSLVYYDKINIPFINRLLISSGIKDNKTMTKTSGKRTDDQQNKKTNTETKKDDELSVNYQVEDFDAESYFKNNTDLKSSFDVETSNDILSEKEVYSLFNSLGFRNVEITCEYDTKGNYTKEKVISSYGSQQHPVYNTIYLAKSGYWMISVVNGSIYAMPTFYNYSDEATKAIILSETDTLTSYDRVTNKFYINIPRNDDLSIVVVDKINAELLDSLTKEEIDKL